MTGIDDLYLAADLASSAFTSILTVDVVAAVSDVFPEVGSRVKVAPLKDRARAAEKARDDYGKRAHGPGEAWLYDIVRGAVECDSQQQVCAIVSALQSLSPRVQVVRLKNRFKNPTPSGFRDINMNLRVEIAAGVFHICELQIHLKAIYDFNYANHSHHHYEYFRTYFRGSVESVRRRLELFRQLDAGVVGTKAGGVGAAVVGGGGCREDGDGEIDGALFLMRLVEQALAAKGEDQLLGLIDLLKQVSEIEHCETLTRSLLVMREEKYGIENEETLDTVNNLGILLSKQGKLDEAYVMYRRALDGKEKALGADHADTLMTVNNLGFLLKDQDKFDEADVYFQRALTGFTSTLGENHPSALNTLHAIGQLRVKQGLLDAASEAYGRVRVQYERLYGEGGHVGYYLLLHDMGELELQRAAAPLARRPLDARAAAESLFELALAGRERLLGPQHTDSVASAAALARARTAPALSPQSIPIP